MSLTAQHWFPLLFPWGNGGRPLQVYPVSIVWSSCGCGGYPRHQEHGSSSANTFGDCHQVSLSVWAQTPPEMVIQGQVSLVSHKGNLKVTPEWLGQEKYYTTLCLYLNEFSFPSCKTHWPLDRAQCIQVNHAGRSIQTSLRSRINDEKEKAVKGGRAGLPHRRHCACVCSWPFPSLFFQLNPIFPAVSVTTGMVALGSIIVNSPVKPTVFKCLQRAKHGPTCSGGFVLPTKNYLVGTTALNLRLMKIQHSYCKESKERNAVSE